MFSELNSDHQAELSKYLKFFHLKKEQFLKERDHELKDFKKDLQDDLYNREDVKYIRNFMIPFHISDFGSKSWILTKNYIPYPGGDSLEQV